MLQAILSSIGQVNDENPHRDHSPADDNGPMEGSPEYLAGKAALRRCWESFGFRRAHGDCLVFEDVADGID